MLFSTLCSTINKSHLNYYPLSVSHFASLACMCVCVCVCVCVCAHPVVYARGLFQCKGTGLSKVHVQQHVCTV